MPEFDVAKLNVAVEKCSDTDFCCKHTGGPAA